MIQRPWLPPDKCRSPDAHVQGYVQHAVGHASQGQPHRVEGAELLEHLGFKYFVDSNGETRNKYEN